MPVAARTCSSRRALTLVETVITLVLIAALVSILLPALSSARTTSYRDQCADNLRGLGRAWADYLRDHQNQFPHVAGQPGWMYGGVGFSSIEESAYPDLDRPLTPYMGLRQTGEYHGLSCFCPADEGIEDDEAGASAGTGGRTAFRTFGTSYRANAALFSGPADSGRGMLRSEITTPPSRLLVMGDPVWHEVAAATGRDADWHGERGLGNLLFLDGSVRFRAATPAPVVGPVVLDPRMPGSAPASDGEGGPGAPPAEPAPEASGDVQVDGAPAADDANRAAVDRQPSPRH